MTDRILEIIQRNYDKFTGTNEAELHAAEEIAALFKFNLSESQLAELASIGCRHTYVLEDEMRMSHNGVLEIVKRYEEIKTLNASKGEDLR